MIDKVKNQLNRVVWSDRMGYDVIVVLIFVFGLTFLVYGIDSLLSLMIN